MASFARRRRGQPGGFADSIRVREYQQMRIIDAMVAVACERGARSVTVVDVINRAGVSRKTFYDIFADRDDCLLAVIDHGVACATDRVRDACETQRSWIERVRAGLRVMLEFFEEEPALARLCVVDGAFATPATLARRQELLDLLVEIVDEGRSGVSREPSPLAAESVVGGVFGVIHSRLLRSGGAALVELVGPLMSVIVLPYLGPAAARREQNRPVPAARPGASARVHCNPVDGLNIRLTYRTMRVLTAVGAQSGLSNREISELAGIKDQGQMSKLLARLSSVGLLENAADTLIEGSPNAWRLTRRGEDVERMVSHERYRG